MSSVDQSGTFALGDLHVRRLGFGAMQLSGPAKNSCKTQSVSFLL